MVTCECCNEANQGRHQVFSNTLANVDPDDDEHVSAPFPMCAFELVSAVPEDAADDKKQENLFLIMFFFFF